MKGELFINGKDAWETWGVNMGDGFLDAIDGFLPMKEFIENESRLEHGKRMICAEPRVASRDLTLRFTIKGESKSDFRSKKKAFESEMYNGNVDIQVPELGGDIFHLVYTGKSISYAMNRTRTFCTISSKFEEPNPMDRASEDDENN